MSRFDFTLFFEITIPSHGVAPLALIALRMDVKGTTSSVDEFIAYHREFQG